MILALEIIEGLAEYAPAVRYAKEAPVFDETAGHLNQPTRRSVIYHIPLAPKSLTRSASVRRKISRLHWSEKAAYRHSVSGCEYKNCARRSNPRSIASTANP
jgi:hypothetical protein